MDCTVFYSWQSQLPNSTNRGFIRDALDKAAHAVRNDVTIEARPELDHDTANVPGSPNIADTIRAKIDAAEVVVCDVSIVQGRDGDGEKVRPTPNPNVLIELGYAMKSLGTMDRMILVMNTAYGDVSLRPFDLRQSRPVMYELAEGTDGKADARKALAAQFEKTLRHVLAAPSRRAAPEISPAALAIQAVEAVAPNAESAVKRYMDRLVDSLVGLAPHWTRTQEQDEEALIRAIASTSDLVAEYARLCRSVADLNSAACARILYGGLAPIVEKHFVPRGSGTFRHCDFDFFKFVSHELIVSLAAALAGAERWQALDDVLRQELYVETGQGPLCIAFPDTRGAVTMFDARGQRLRRLSVQADLLKERHSDGELARQVPFDSFVDADVLLFLRSEFIEPPTAPYRFWYPHSAVYLEYRQPSFVTRAESTAFATRLLKALGCGSIEKVRKAYEEQRPGWGHIFRNAPTPPLLRLDLSKFGTR